MKALPPLPPPTKEQENIVPMIAPAANAEKKQKIYDSLMQAENDPITAGLVQSYLRRQQKNHQQPAIKNEPSSA